MTTPAKVDNEVIKEHGKPYNNTSFIDGLISNFHLPKRENGSKVSFLNFDTQKHSIPKTPTIKEFSNYINASPEPLRGFGLCMSYIHTLTPHSFGSCQAIQSERVGQIAKDNGI